MSQQNMLIKNLARKLKIQGHILQTKLLFPIKDNLTRRGIEKQRQGNQTSDSKKNPIKSLLGKFFLEYSVNYTYVRQHDRLAWV